MDNSSRSILVSKHTSQLFTWDYQFNMFPGFPHPGSFKMAAPVYLLLFGTKLVSVMFDYNSLNFKSYDFRIPFN